MRQTEWPNPDAVVYATTQPPGFPCQMTSRDPGKNLPIHSHGAFLNKEGDGNTDVDSGHFHRVRGFKVLPDESDGHTHQLTMLPCGVGAPQSVGRQGQLVTLGDGTQQFVQLMDPPKSKKVWWILGGVAVVGLVIGGYVLYQHMQEE